MSRTARRLIALLAAGSIVGLLTVATTRGASPAPSGATPVPSSIPIGPGAVPGAGASAIPGPTGASLAPAGSAAPSSIPWVSIAPLPSAGTVILPPGMSFTPSTSPPLGASSAPVASQPPTPLPSLNLGSSTYVEGIVVTNQDQPAVQASVMLSQTDSTYPYETSPVAVDSEGRFVFTAPDNLAQNDQTDTNGNVVYSVRPGNWRVLVQASQGADWQDVFLDSGTNAPTQELIISTSPNYLVQLTITLPPDGSSQPPVATVSTPAHPSPSPPPPAYVNPFAQTQSDAAAIYYTPALFDITHAGQSGFGLFGTLYLLVVLWITGFLLAFTIYRHFRLPTLSRIRAIEERGRKA